MSDWLITDNGDGTYTVSQSNGGKGGGATLLIIAAMILLDIAMLIGMPIIFFTVFGGEDGLGYLTGIPFAIAYLVFLFFNIYMWPSYFIARRRLKKRKEDIDILITEEMSEVRLGYNRLFANFLVKLENLCKWFFYAALTLCIIFANIPNSPFNHEILMSIFIVPCAYYYLLKIVVFCIFVKRNELGKKHFLTPVISLFASPIAAILFMLLVYLVQLPFYVEGGYYLTFENLEMIVILIFWALPLDIHMAIARKKLRKK